MAKLTKAQMGELDTAVLSASDKYGRSATYVLRNIVYPTLRSLGVDTPHVLRACRRLAARGLMEEVPSSYITMKTWQITPAGRLALQEHTDERR